MILNYIYTELAMKRIILKLLIVILFMVAPQTVLTQTSDGSETGFSGSLLCGAFISQTNSQLYVVKCQIRV